MKGNSKEGKKQNEAIAEKGKPEKTNRERKARKRSELEETTVREKSKK